jgi:hypothetical protein
VTDEGVVFGGRLVRWGDVEDVKAWSESFREAEVESSPVIGYGMYGYAVGRTLPSTTTYRSTLSYSFSTGTAWRQYILRGRSTGHS